MATNDGQMGIGDMDITWDAGKCRSASRLSPIGSGLASMLSLAAQDKSRIQTHDPRAPVSWAPLESRTLWREKEKCPHPAGNMVLTMSLLKNSAHMYSW